MEYRAMKRHVLAGLGAACLALAAAQGQAQEFQPLDEDPETLNFGIISTESTQNLKRQWLPFLADMEEMIGKKVEAFFAPDYAGVIEGMRFGKVHVAWFGNKSAMEAVRRAGAEIFARQVKWDGTEGYNSVLLTHVDNTEVNSLEDMLAECGAGKDFGIGDPNSTSGFLVPSYYVFARNDVRPEDCFATVRSANHETNLMAVANKQVHYATNNTEQVLRSQKNAPEAAANVKVIWTSPLIPSDPITFRKDLSRDLKDQIRAFFLTYGRLGPGKKEALEVLGNMTDGLAPFTASTNAQLYPIVELDLFRQKIKLLNDERMDRAERDARIAEIDEKLATLGVLSAGLDQVL